MERLDKLLAATGKWSRKEAKALLKAGRVQVDGVTARSPEEKAPEGARVTVDGRPVSTEKYTYLMLHKPAGVVSSTEDPRERTVLSLLPPDLRRLELFPVGRLDKDTEGLLLLTNDGETAHDLLAPKKHVDKVYYTRVSGTLTRSDCDAFAAGMTLDDGLVCQNAVLTILSAGQESEALVTIHEGKFHQIKRMLAFLGKPVLYLKRLQMGPLKLDETLHIGEFRLLTPQEVEQIAHRQSDQ